MKSSLSRILFICVVLLSVLRIKSAKEINIKLFDHVNFEGDQQTVTLKEGQCHNLDGFDNRASSVIYC